MTPETRAKIAALSAQERLALAVQWREKFWSGPWLSEPEDRRISELQSVCTQLCCGDSARGNALAVEAVWS